MDDIVEKIDLNTADEEMLATLPGIGVILARRIIEYRETVRPFEEVIELAAVPGISERMVREIADRLTVLVETDADLPAVSALETDEPPAEIESPADIEPDIEMEPVDEEEPAADIEPDAEMELVEEKEPVDELEPDAELEPADESDVLPEAEPLAETGLALEAPPAAEEEEVEQALPPVTEMAYVAETDAEEPVLPLLEEAERALTAGEAPSEAAGPADEAVALPPAETGEEEPAEAPWSPTTPAPELEASDSIAEGDILSLPELETGARESAPAQAPAAPAPAPRLGRIAFLAGIVGALFGVLLTLALLYGLNDGTLRFASAATAGSLRSDLVREADTARQAQESLAGELTNLNQETGRLADALDALTEQQGALRQALAETQGDVSDLEETANALDERIAGVAEAAENFDAFLTRLRDLLVELQGLPPTPTSTPVSTASPDSQVTPGATAVETLSPEPTATSGSASPPATRTPRPTATPFGGPTITPLP